MFPSLKILYSQKTWENIWEYFRNNFVFQLEKAYCLSNNWQLAFVYDGQVQHDNSFCILPVHLILNDILIKIAVFDDFFDKCA